MFFLLRVTYTSTSNGYQQKTSLFTCCSMSITRSVASKNIDSQATTSVQLIDQLTALTTGQHVMKINMFTLEMRELWK